MQIKFSLISSHINQPIWRCPKGGGFHFKKGWGALEGGALVKGGRGLHCKNLYLVTLVYAYSGGGHFLHFQKNFRQGIADFE